MIKKAWANVRYIITNGFNLVLILFSILGSYFTFFEKSSEELELGCKVIIVISCVVVGYLFYFFKLYVIKRVVVYKEDSKEIAIQYGDIIDIIDTNEKNGENAVFVVPVNRCFDTIADNTIVEKESVHGQFINYFTDNIFPLDVLDKKIEESLKTYEYDIVTNEEKDKGKNKRYPIGTVAKVESVKGNIFYLVALTTFKKVGSKITVDDNINIYDYLKCLQSMVDYYNVDGRNLPIYIPTIGCGLSRLNISIDNSIRQLLSIWNLNHDVIRNAVNIVVYKENFWDIQILKYKKEGK